MSLLDEHDYDVESEMRAVCRDAHMAGMSPAMYLFLENRTIRAELHVLKQRQGVKPTAPDAQKGQP